MLYDSIRWLLEILDPDIDIEQGYPVLKLLIGFDPRSIFFRLSIYPITPHLGYTKYYNTYMFKQY